MSLKCLQYRYYIGVDLPACVFFKFLCNEPRELVEARLVVFLDERPKQVHVVVDPELVDGLFAGPGMTIETSLAKVVVLGLIYALCDLVDVDVQVYPLAGPL